MRRSSKWILLLAAEHPAHARSRRPRLPSRRRRRDGQSRPPAHPRRPASQVAVIESNGRIRVDSPYPDPDHALDL